MRLTKSQGIVITLLNIVIVALVAVILFVPNFSQGESADSDVPAATDPVKPTEPEEPVHNKFRAPSEGKADGVVSETRLMGLGDESACNVFFLGGAIFVFGNASVKGLDFDVYGGFVCKLSESGTILAYSYFDGKITAACMYGDGFIAAAGGKLYSVDGECDLTVRVDETDGDAVDVFAVDNKRVALVSQPSSTSLKLTEYTVTDGKFGTGHSTRIDSGYTLKYFDCFMFSDTYVMAVRAHSLPRYDSLVMYSFTAGGDAKDNNYGGTGENLTRPYGVMPCADGYIAVAAKNGIATLINIDYAFTVYRAQSLGFTVSDARLLFSGGSYYACFTRTDGAVTYKIDGVAERESISAFDGITLTAASDGYFMGSVGGLDSTGEKYVAVNLVNGDKTVRSLAVSGGEVYALKRSGDCIIAVLSASGGDELSTPSGGRDIYVLVLKTE